MLATIFVVIFVVVSIAVIVFVLRRKARSAAQKRKPRVQVKSVLPTPTPTPQLASERVAAIRKILDDYGKITYAEGRERLLEMGLYVPVVSNMSAHFKTLREYDIALEGDDAVELIQDILEISTETACEVFEEVLAWKAYRADRNNWDVTVHLWKRRNSPVRPARTPRCQVVNNLEVSET